MSTDLPKKILPSPSAVTEFLVAKPNPFITSSCVAPKETNPFTTIAPQANTGSNPFLNPAKPAGGN